MTAEILVVDDIDVHARTLADWLRLKTRLTVEAASTLDSALEFVQTSQIKVAVLDQRMEDVFGVDGTTLARRIHEIDPRVRCIIFSGESDVPDYLQSNELMIRHLTKGDEETLLNVVYEYRLAYLVAIEREALPKASRVGVYRPRTILRGAPVEFDLLLEETVSREPEAADSDFVAVVRVDRGQRLTTTDSSVVVQEIQIEQESTDELVSSGLVKAAVLGELSSSLAVTLRERRSAIGRFQDQVTHTQENTYELSEADVADDIVAFEIQRAPLVCRKRAVIRITCRCCDLSNVVTIGFREWSGEYARRRVEYRRESGPRTIDLGRG